MRLRALCCAALLGLLVSPGLADIVVTMDPVYHAVDISAGTTSVEIWADIPEEDAIVGFAFDVDIVAGELTDAERELAARLESERYGTEDFTLHCPARAGKEGGGARW